jgi:hypothetical protein
MKLGQILLSGVLAATPPTVMRPAVETGDGCLTSPLIRQTAPSDPSADGVGPADWYINGDRTIWAGTVPAGGWPAGGKLFSGNSVVKGQKTYWVRPAGTQLLITGRRLDGDGPPVEAHVPCCYPTGFQIVGLFFPTEGCWEVLATAGDSELRFVTQVKRSVTAEKN